MSFPESNSVHTVATRSIRAVAGLWSSLMARSSNFWMAAAWKLICWRGILVRWLGLCSTDVSTGRVSRKKPQRSVPRGHKSSKGPLLEPPSKISWLRGTKSPKCVRLNVNKPFGKTFWYLYDSRNASCNFRYIVSCILKLYNFFESTNCNWSILKNRSFHCRFVFDLWKSTFSRNLTSFTTTFFWCFLIAKPYVIQGYKDI